MQNGQPLKPWGFLYQSYFAPDLLDECEYQQQLEGLSLYRIMVKGEGYKFQLRQNDFMDDKLAEGLGFGDYVFSDEPKIYNLTEVKQKLFKLAGNVEANKLSYNYNDTQFRSNIERLAELIGLSKIETEILIFCATVQTNALLESAINILGDQSARDIEKILCICLDSSEMEIRQSLLPASKLIRSGLINVDMSGRYQFTQKIELLNGLVDQLHIHSDEPENILKNIIFLSNAPKLTIDKYGQLQEEVNLISGYLN